MKTIDIYRGSSVFKTVNIDEKTIFSQKLMNEHKITCDITVDEVIMFQIGDYIQFRDEKFYINRVPGISKKNTKSFNYKIDFEGELYGLYSKLFMHEGVAEFSYTGNAGEFLTLIISCMGQIASGWGVGSVDESTELNIDFSGDSCRTALTKIVDKFKMEFFISGRTISLKNSIGNETSYRFEYGKGLGLYQINREQVSDQNIVTRVYGFGGTNNIPYTYRDGAKKLVFEDRFIEKNVDLYGLIEGQFTNEEIYPRRTGSVTAVKIQFEDLTADPQLKQEFYIEDSSIDFDINNNLIEGKNATIVFKSGDLSGVEFEIYKATYDTINNIKRLYFNPYSDSNGYTLPNQLNQPSVSDQYTLVNLNLPQAYVDDAEAELLHATQNFIDQNSVPQVVYSVTTDPKFVKVNSVLLSAGDMVTVVDSQLGIDALIRISDISFPIVNENKIQLTISDTVPYTVQQRMIKTIVETKKETFYIDKKAEELSRRNTMRQKQLKDLLFDADQYFDATNIKPLSIESKYLSIGSKSEDFILDGVTIQPNFEGDENSIVISAGQLLHRQIEVKLSETVTLNTWNIGAFATAGLSSGASYYLYAKCSKTAGSGAWLLSVDKHLADGELEDKDDHNFYFLVGILFSVFENARDYDFTFGMTYINGRTITTGRIRSVNKLNYFDLDQNKFMLGDSNSGLDWNVTAANRLTIRGLLLQSQSGDSFPSPVYRGAYGSTITYYKGDQVTYNGSTYMFTSDTPSSGFLPTNATYWNVVALAGATGTDGNFIEYRFAKNTSATVAPALTTTSLSPTGWSVTPPSINTNEYLWVSTAKKNSTASVLVSPWTAPVRWSGVNGTDGSSITGATGDFFEYRYAKNGSTSAAPSLTVTDVNPTGWSTTMPSVGVLEYLWMTSSKKDGSGATLKIYWSTPIRVSPVNGTNGLSITGATGDFVEFQYAKNQSPEAAPAITVSSLNPTGWSTIMPTCGASDYLWVTSARKNAAGTSLVTNWNAPSRSTGLPGQAGIIGATPVFRGDYDPTKVYYGTSSRVDIVRYGSLYYVARTDAGSYSGILPTDSSKWNSFGAQFDSVATDLLFANLAYVDNLGVRYLRTETTGQRVEINGDTGTLNFYNASNQLVMSLSNGILSAIGAQLTNAVFTSGSAISSSAVKIDGGEMLFSETTNGEFSLTQKTIEIGAGGIDLWQLLGRAVKHVIIHNLNATLSMDGEEITVKDASGNVTAKMDLSGLFGKVVSANYLSAPQLNMLRPLTSSEISAAPAYSIYVDTNGRHVAKDGNGTPHTLW